MKEGKRAEKEYQKLLCLEQILIDELVLRPKCKQTIQKLEKLQWKISLIEDDNMLLFETKNETLH